MTKYYNDSVFGSTSMEWSDGPQWKVEYPSVEEIQQRQQLESTLARTFIQWRKTVDPSERSRLWNAMEEAVRELEKLNNE